MIIKNLSISDIKKDILTEICFCNFVGMSFYNFLDFLVIVSAQ